MVQSVTVDDFEDGDIAEWTGDTGNFTVTSNGFMEGSNEVRGDAGDIYSITSDVNVGDVSPSKVVCQIRADGHANESFDRQRVRVEDSGGSSTSIVRMSHGSGQDFKDLEGNAIFTWSTDTTYRVEIVQQSDGTYDYIVNGTTYTTGISWSQKIDDFELVQNNSGGSNYNGYWDELYVEYEEEPTAPSDLSVTQGSEDQLDLSWSDNSSVEEGFYVYRAQSSGSTTSDYSQVADLSENTTSYTDGSLEDGERYFYRVTAYNGTTESDPSNEDDAVTVLPSTTPSLDTSVEDEITVSWTKQDDSSDGNWEIYKSEDGTLGTEITGGLSTGTSSFTDGSLEDGEEYHYTLRRTTNHASADGSQKSGIAVLPGPSGLSLDTGTEDEISLSWTRNDDSPDGDVEVLRSTDGTTGSVVATLTNDSTAYTDTSLSDGEEYHYTVRRNTDHTSTDSSQASGVTVLPAPTGLGVDAVRDAEADISWTDNHDYGDTRIDYKRSSASSWTTFSTLSRNTEAETITGLLNGEEYDARVVAETEHTETVDA